MIGEGGLGFLMFNSLMLSFLVRFFGSSGKILRGVYLLMNYNLFICLFNKYLLVICFRLGFVLSVGNVVMNKIKFLILYFC